MRFAIFAALALAAQGCAIFQGRTTAAGEARYDRPPLEQASFSPGGDASRERPLAVRRAFGAGPVGLVPCSDGAPLSAACARRTSHEQPDSIDASEAAAFGVVQDN